MKEKNLQLAQKDIDDALETVESIEKCLDSSSFSKDTLKDKFLELSNKVQELENLLKVEGII
ncbi:hypothetical protein [Clostridium fallax]|uniref:Uncharacterized protein n=1 Tax=Clostridium fallax TaxID=1533 RepID=A0A1M4T903_9CLOT|nr:hypothetical protein [Clostridium fallax]SHE40983.1 hypothetical protein SAMN05443638_10279 [Clostridium fallax]SQB22657.1 Uncharacterised protein [Clostridium fallax]